MQYQIPWQDVTCIDYPGSFSPTGSSIDTIDTTEELDILFSLLIKQRSIRRFPCQSLLSVLEIDLSSVRPRLEIKSETSLWEIKEVSEDIIIGMTTHDFIVHIPPIREYTIRVGIEKVEKASPHIVELEGV